MKHVRDEKERNLNAWSALAGLLVFAALAGPFFAGRVYTGDDLGAFHLPLRAHYARQLAAGDSFDWMPQLYCGFYVTGEGQMGGYHPFHRLIYWLLPLHAAFAWEILSPYPLMMAGMWLFLRRLLRCNTAALVGSLFFTFCSFNLLHLIHPNAVAIVAHIPWLLWAIDVVLLNSRRWKVATATVLIALLTASQLLLGYPQYVWFSLLIEGSCAGFTLWTHRYAPRRECDACDTCADCIGCTDAAWPRLLIAKCVGLLLAGVQVCPTIDALTSSVRQSADPQFSLWGSLHPLNLAQLVAPYLFVHRVAGDNTHEFGLYLGVVPLMLLAWLFARRHELGNSKRLALALAGLTLLALLLAFGEFGPIYYLVTLLPVVKTFRFPCRYLLIFQFAAMLLAAIGFWLLLEENKRCQRRGQRDGATTFVQRCFETWREFEPLWVVVITSIAVAVTGVVMQNRECIASMTAIAVGPVLCLAAAALVMFAARGRQVALVGLIVLALADQAYYGLSYSVYRNNADLDQWIAAANTPPEKSDGRVLASLVCWNEPGLRTGNRMTMAGWSRADGYAGLEPKRLLHYSDVPALRTAGVRWVQTGPTTDAISGLRPHDPRWREVPDPLPRVRLVTRTLVSNSPAGDMVHICPDEVALTEVPIILPPSKPGTATLLDDRPGHMQIQIDCPRKQLLVISESYHPGWQAVVDGQPREVHRINGDFMGCLVGPGKERLTLTFQPASLRCGRLASCIGAALLPLCLFGCLAWPKRPRAGKSGESSPLNTGNNPA